MNQAPDRIRILRIIARMNIGGPAIQVTNLMQSLPDSQFDQLLLTGRCESSERDYLETHDVNIQVRKIRWLGRKINPISDFMAFLEIRRIIGEFRPDIIHTHTFKAGIIGRVAAITKFRRTLLVHTYHGHLLHGYFGRFGTRIVILIERVLARKTTRLVSVGIRVQGELLESGIGITTQYKVINPGFKIDHPKSISRKNYGFTEEDFICGWFGRVTKIKRVDRVLEIASFAKLSKYKNVKFLVVGGGALRDELETQAKEQELPVVFLGWQNNVFALMKMCNIVFCTSENEGTPISLIEAQMLGRPVVSTNVGSVKEVMISSKTGFALDYQAERYWEKIAFFVNDSVEYEKFSSNASNFAINSFSLEKFIARHILLYSEILGVNPILRP